MAKLTLTKAKFSVSFDRELEVPENVSHLIGYLKHNGMQEYKNFNPEYSPQAHAYLWRINSPLQVDQQFMRAVESFLDFLVSQNPKTVPSGFFEFKDDHVPVRYYFFKGQVRKVEPRITFPDPFEDEKLELMAEQENVEA